MAGKGQYKKVSSCIFIPYFFPRKFAELFLQVFVICFMPQVVAIFMIFDLATQISIFTHFWRTNMKIRFDESFSP